MSEPNVGAVIVKHIDELEAALRYANTTMQPLLAKAAARVLDEKRHELGWAGEAPADFDEAMWLAPEDWRMGGSSEENDFYLSFSLQPAPCFDDEEPETWLGTIAGFAGAGIRLEASTDALGPRAWKALLRSEQSLIDELVARGFRFEPKAGDIALTIVMNRESLAAGFEDEMLDAAFEPMAHAIDGINSARPVLDLLVEAIKRAADR
ncbi:hypothetical protein J2X73_004627 [Novosphingobium sp. 1748]|uniref:hypothetical protein n=1 Tax=Novosphingobium sp. 1748 TaxID=2817760 RepID=UPI00285589A9|nr:hypothetical protein [Novosphingobium sp. 1748]MDR6710222.1 hypothetical protein [Novosphingobium sp. 1748]